MYQMIYESVCFYIQTQIKRDHSGRDHMVVGFIVEQSTPITTKVVSLTPSTVYLSYMFYVNVEFCLTLQKQRGDHFVI